MHAWSEKAKKISIHALREEGDFLRLTAGALLDAFLSTPSAKRATISVSRTARRSADFYPRPPRGGRPIQLDAVDMVIGISIHALREEGDLLHLHGKQLLHISIHALREEGDVCQPDLR